MLFATLVGSQGQIYAFEPSSENCRLMLMSINLNGFRNITVFPVALSDRVGSALYTPHVGSNGGLLANSYEELFNPNCSVVPGFTLDSILPAGEVDPLSSTRREQKDWRQRDHETYLRTSTHRDQRSQYGDARACVRNEPRRLPRFFPWTQLSYFRDRASAGDLSEIYNIDKFLAGWGHLGRIENLAMIPAEKVERFK